MDCDLTYVTAPQQRGKTLEGGRCFGQCVGMSLRYGTH